MHDVIRNEKDDLIVLKKTIRWYFLYYGIPCLLATRKSFFWNFRRWKIRSIFEPQSWWKDDIYWILKSSCFEIFRDGKYSLFLSQKVDGKMIFTEYWKVLVLNVLENGNTVPFWAKKLTEKWYLLNTEKLLFWNFQSWEIQSFFEPKS